MKNNSNKSKVFDAGFQMISETPEFEKMVEQMKKTRSNSRKTLSDKKAA